MFRQSKGKFHLWLAHQLISTRAVYGSNYSLCVEESEIINRGYSSIVTRLLNEEKAISDQGFVYIDPYYDKYDKDTSYRNGKLLQAIKLESFQAMINQSELTSYNSDKYRGIFYRIPQKDLRRFNSVQVAGQLIRKNLAFLDDTTAYLYLDINYQNSLEKKSKISGDLSGFLTLLGEGNSLKMVIDLLEEAQLIKIESDKHRISISQELVRDYGMQTQFFSLVNLGIAELNESKDYLLSPEFSSWVLDYADNACDRVSFVAIYEGLF